MFLFLVISSQKARHDYQTLLSEAARILSAQSKKLKSSIQSARPYYELQVQKKGMLKKLQANSKAYRDAQTEHDKAVSVLGTYNIDIAKFNVGDESQLEVVNGAIQKVRYSGLISRIVISHK